MMLLGVSHWAYDAQSVAQRNFTGETEENFLQIWNERLESKLHLGRKLEGVFIDAWSQQPWNINDQSKTILTLIDTILILNFDF